MKKLIMSVGMVLLLSSNAFAGGWYLLNPPLRFLSNGPILGFDTSAPLSEWGLDESYDSAKECNAENRDEIKFAKHELKSKSLSKEDIIFYRDREIMHILSRCIASDDPRLAK
jgi:hypothetical protein